MKGLNAPNGVYQDDCLLFAPSMYLPVMAVTVEQPPPATAGLAASTGRNVTALLAPAPDRALYST